MNSNYLSAIFANSAQKYTYKNHDLTVKPGDYIVVNTPSGGMQVVKVAEVDLAKPKFPCKWIVTKVDLTTYQSLEDSEETNDASAIRSNKRLS